MSLYTGGMATGNPRDKAGAGNSSLYTESLQQGQALVRQALLDTAGETLRREGLQALSMRKVAAAVGCSTMVLYSNFGSKDGLLDALFLEGFRRLHQALQATPDPGDADAHVLALCHTYRRAAHAAPAYYAIMFQGAIAEYEAPPASREQALATLDPLIEVVWNFLQHRDGSPYHAAREMAMRLWAAAHGIVSLELAGMLSVEVGDAIYERTLRDLLHTA